MKVARSFEEFRETRGRVVLAAGFFDGIHRGHRKVLSAAVDKARAADAAPWVLTFDRHPFELLVPERAPKLLTSTARKLELIESLGFEGCLVLPFTRELASLSPAEFVASLVEPRRDGSGSEHSGVVALHCGGNWTFGAKAAGTPDVLRRLGHRRGFEVAVARAIRCLGENISSTRIRRAVAGGDLALAERMLGRPHSVDGTIGHGRAVGRTIGRPTANLEAGYNAAIPPDGVYAVRVFLGNGREGGDAAKKNGAPFSGVANIGVRPTFADGGDAPERTFEVHLLDFGGDLYGRDMRVEFVRFLRPETAFPSPAALAAQIARDIDDARGILGARA